MECINGLKYGKTATEEAISTLSIIPHQTKKGVAFSLNYKLTDDVAKLSINYTVTPLGDLTVDFNFTPLKDSLPNIPRLGMYLTLPNNYTKTAWYGRGPQETYWDRKSSGKIAIYEGYIIDQFHRYVRPQETGNKTDIRWMSVQSNKTTLTVNSTDNELLNGSVWPFANEELDFFSWKKMAVNLLRA